MGYYLLLLYWALRGALFLPKGCFAVATATYLFLSPTAGVFRGSDRDPLAFVSDGPLSPAAGNVAHSAGRNQRFLHFLARSAVGKGESACHTFALIFLRRSVKGLSQQQRRCR